MGKPHVMILDEPAKQDDPDYHDWQRALISISETVTQLCLDNTLSHENLTSFLIDMFPPKTHRLVNSADPTPNNSKQRWARAQRL